MDVDILISKPLLLKIELHAAVRIFTAEKLTLCLIIQTVRKTNTVCASLQRHYFILIYMWP